MGMQYDVKSKYLTADGVITDYRTRVKSVTVTVSTAGAATIIYDNATAASGDVLITLSTAAVGSYQVLLPGEGILAQNGVFVDINGAAAVSVVFG